jgi:hypothetical protein
MELREMASLVVQAVGFKYASTFVLDHKLTTCRRPCSKGKAMEIRDSYL